MAVNIRGRSFLKLLDYTPAEIRYLLDLSKNFKDMKRAGVPHRWLEGKNIVLLFEKTSTRTRCSFEVAGMDLGMGVTYLEPGSSQMGKKESIADTARVLGRMYDGIEYRGFSQDLVQELSDHAGVPVWNGLTDQFHPTQMLADLLTIEEKLGRLKGVRFTYFGDARNNMGNSLMVACAKMGMHFTACAPKELFPDTYSEKFGLTLMDKDNMPMILTATKTLDQNANAADAAKRGAFWDLTEYLQDSEAYPNLSQISPDVLKGLTVDGQIIGIPRSRAIGRNGLGYRTDWAEAVGITEAPKTVEDVYDMLYKFTYDDPDGNGANDTYGLEMCKYTGPWDIIQTWFGCGNGWVEQDGKLVPVHQTAEYKEALDWMRKIYADGLVRPDWATVDTANFQVDSQKGVTGVFVDTMDGTKRIWKYFEDNAIADVNDASKIATMTSVGPINGHTLATTGYNGFYLITKSGAKTEEDVKACLHFLDKMCDPEMMALADYGLKDICYDINENGKIVPNGKYDTTNCPHAGLNQAVPYVPYLTEQNPDYQLEKADYQLAYEESIANNVQYAVFNPALGYLTQSDTYAECGSDLVQILDDARTQYICGQIDEAGLQAAFDQWNARGGTQVIEEVNALYAADKA